MHRFSISLFVGTIGISPYTASVRYASYIVHAFSFVGAIGIGPYIACVRYAPTMCTRFLFAGGQKLAARKCGIYDVQMRHLRGLNAAFTRRKCHVYEGETKSPRYQAFMFEAVIS